MEGSLRMAGPGSRSVGEGEAFCGFGPASRGEPRLLGRLEADSSGKTVLIVRRVQ